MINTTNIDNRSSDSPVVNVTLAVDEVQQELHDLKQQVKTFKALENEYQEEISWLQNGKDEKYNALHADIETFKKKIANDKDVYNEMIATLEKQLSEKDKENEALKQELKTIGNIASEPKNSTDDTLLTELLEIRKQNADLLEQLDEVTQVNIELKDNSQGLQESVNRLQTELLEYKQSYESKQSQLAETNMQMQLLKDDYFAVKTELDAAKSTPLDDKSQGNSLFAEVNDRRLQLQKKLDSIQTKYMEMRQEHNSHQGHVNDLRQENCRLIAKVKVINEEKDDEYERLLHDKQKMIDVLKVLVESLKKDLAEKREHLTGELDVINAWSAIKDKEVDSWREKFYSKSTNLNVLTHDMVEDKRVIRRLKAQIVELQNELMNLKHEMKSLKLKKELEIENLEKQLIEKKENDLESEQKTVETVEEHKPILKNITNQSVRFCDTTVEPKITDRVEMRRRGRVQILKPTHVVPKM